MMTFQELHECVSTIAAYLLDLQFLARAMHQQTEEAADIPIRLRVSRAEGAFIFIVDSGQLMRPKK